MQHTLSLTRVAICGCALGLSTLVAQGQVQKPETLANGPTKVVSFPYEVKGVVIDAATQKAVTGARVSYKTASTAITDDAGAFKLRVPNYQISVVVEISGYQSIEVALSGRKSLEIALNEDEHPSVYKVYNLPTNSFTGNRLASAASTAQLNDVWSRGGDSPDSYLQGKIAGLNVIRHSGIASTAASMFLRGFTSLQATNQPLIVVDNVVYDNNQNGNSLISNFLDNPLLNIDVRDISNITVLKDASAAALYGTKAANGVILITTARAKELGTKIDLATYGGINLMPQALPILNVGDYRTYLSDLLKSGGYSTQAIQALPYMNDDKTADQYYQFHNNTNWQKQLYSNNPLQNIYLKITGGDNIAKYALSLNYMKNQSAMIGSDLAKYSTRFNADLNLSRRLKGIANLSFSYNEANTKDLGFSPKTNPIYLSLVKAPFLSDHDISNLGTASPDLSDEDIFKIGNPTVASTVMSASNRSYRFQGTLAFQYTLTPALSLGTTVGVIFDKIKETRFVPKRGILSDTLSNAIAENKLGSQTKRLFNLYNDTYLSYTKTIGFLHEFSGRIGAKFLNSKIEQDKILGYNSATDELKSVGNGVPVLNKINGGIGTSNWLNTYVNLNYAYSDKYFLSFNLGMDASSRFGKEVSTQSFKAGGVPVAVMPSLAAAWAVSSENFMANSIFDLLKIRASYGRVGNDDIGNYAAYQYYVGQNLLGTQGLVRGDIANPAIKWESINKANFGIDAAIWNERVSFSFDVFTNKVKDMLVSQKLPTITGLSYVLTNSGAMTTKGLEVALNVKVINKQALKWDVGVMLSKAKSVVDQLPDDNMVTSFGSASYLTKVGQAPNLFYGYVSQGVFTSDAEAAQAGLMTRRFDGALILFKGGDVRFQDLNNDKIIDDNDRQVIGNPTPNFVGSVSNRLTYQSWTLDALFTFASGNSLYNYTRSVLEAVSTTNNQSQAVLNRWRGDGQVTDIPRASLGDPVGNARFSSRWIEDGSYFRLRTITVSYNIPVDKSILKYLTFYGTANNLFTLTKYLGYDPEFSATNSIYGQGVDNMLEPLQKSFQLGIKIGL